MQELAHKRVLVVDDSPEDRALCRSFLSYTESGAPTSVHEADCRIDGLSRLEHESFDCVVLDYDLPDGTGIEFLDECSRRSPDTAVIMLTGNGDESVAVRALKLGAHDYMPKASMTPEGLCRAVGNAIEKSDLDAQLRAKQQELESFAFIAAHDLKAPLWKIRSFVELLVEDCGEAVEGAGRDYMEKIAGSASQMTKLVEGLLDYATSGASCIEQEPVSVSDALDIAISALEMGIAESRARIDVESSLGWVLGDVIALGRLFQNLLGNSIKFTKGRDPHIRIRVEVIDGLKVLCIADNGIGIPESDYESVFGALQRLHGPSDFEGCGLGLATCRNIVQQHRGRIWIESQLGVGTTFFVQLPVTTPTAGRLRPGFL